MLGSIELLALALFIIAVSFITSFIGFRNPAFYERYALDADRIKGDKEFFRIISSGLLHNSWSHLLFNMFFLIIVSYIAGGLTIKSFIVVYVISLVSAGIYVIYFNKKPVEMISASTAAISGVISVAVLSVPEVKNIPFIHLSIPVWVIGAVYLVFASFSISGKGESVNFQLALIGAFMGLIAILFSEPVIVRNNLMVFIGAMVMLPLGVMFGRRNSRIFSFNWKRTPENNDIIENFPDDESELNNLLEKVNTKGIESLSRKERKKLEELSKKI